MIDTSEYKLVVNLAESMIFCFFDVERMDSQSRIFETETLEFQILVYYILLNIESALSPGLQGKHSVKMHRTPAAWCSLCSLKHSVMGFILSFYSKDPTMYLFAHASKSFSLISQSLWINVGKTVEKNSMHGQKTGEQRRVIGEGQLLPTFSFGDFDS